MIKRTEKSYDPVLAKYPKLRRQTQEFKLGLVSSTASFEIFKSRGIETKILNMYVVVRTAITTSDTNYWTFEVFNEHSGGSIGATTMSATPKTTKVTGGAAMGADTPFDITPDQFPYLAASDVLSLTCTKASSAANLVDATVFVEYEVTGVTTTTSTTTTTTTTSSSTSSTTTTTTTTSTTTTSSSTSVT